MRALAYVLLIAVSSASVMISDLYLRPAEIAGTDPHSWDVVGSVGILVGTVLLIADFVKSIFQGDK